MTVEEIVDFNAENYCKLSCFHDNAGLLRTGDDSIPARSYVFSLRWRPGRVEATDR